MTPSASVTGLTPGFFWKTGCGTLEVSANTPSEGAVIEGVSPNCESALCEFRREMERAQRRMARMNMCQE